MRIADGAQAVGGAADGGAAGVSASDGALLELNSGYAGTATGRLLIGDHGILRGETASAQSLDRVTSFTDYASQTGPEATFGDKSTVVVTDYNHAAPPDLSNLGTNADLLFGFTEGTHSDINVTIGNGTPWGGLGKDGQGMGDDIHSRISTGTVEIDSGSGFAELYLHSSGEDYSNDGQELRIGNGSSSPTFTAVNGDPIPARVIQQDEKGLVRLDTTAPDFSGGISKFIVGGNGYSGQLTVDPANGTGGVPIDVESMGHLTPVDPQALDGNVTVKSGGNLVAGQPLNGTGSLTVEDGGYVYLSSSDGLTGSQGADDLQAGAIIRWISGVSDPLDLGSSVAGTVIRMEGGRDNDRSIGGLDATGQILTRSSSPRLDPV